jgi:hypothetical protein
MSPNAILVAVVVGYWSVWTLGCLVLTWKRSKARGGDGGHVSFIPVVPVIPAVLLAFGLAVNAFAEPWGTVVVIGLHAASVVPMVLTSR